MRFKIQGLIAFCCNNQADTTNSLVLGLGIWDEADVLLTHQEFDSGPGTRVTDRDGTSEWGLSDHATHVAGTLIAEGLYPAARGMCYEANLDAYDWTDDVAEMGTAVAEDDLPISNHS